MKTKEYLSNEETKSLKRNPNEVEISNLPDRKFKEIVIRTLVKLENGIEELRGNFSKEKV